uniref:Uncharacterized protein n=1 Tax=Oryza brachyantha TaxID=4533 RepID=J3L3G3_ORYBR
MLLLSRFGGMTNAAYHGVKRSVQCTLKYEVPQYEVLAALHILNTLITRHIGKPTDISVNFGHWVIVIS